MARKNVLRSLGLSILAIFFASLAIAQIPTIEDYECTTMGVGAPGRDAECIANPNCHLQQTECIVNNQPVLVWYRDYETESAYPRCVASPGSACRFHMSGTPCMTWAAYANSGCVNFKCNKSIPYPDCY